MARLDACVTLSRRGGQPLKRRGRDIDAKTRTFREWLSAPIGCISQDSRFEVRRATPDDFHRILDLINTVLRPRSRAEFDWLHQANPIGTARCWLVIERCSGELVASESRFPWPVSRGSERIEGEMSGFAATVPRLQRQGMFQLRSEIRDSHPWHHRTIALGSSPNAMSRGAQAKYGLGHTILGPLPRGVLLLDWSNYLRSHSCPRSAAKMMGAAADVALGLWHNKILASPSNIRTEVIRRFDSGVDALTYSCMSTPSYWCPHEADFLNWRYFENPVNSYVAQVALVDDEVRGYSVVRVMNKRAMLMEFAASAAPKPVAGVLLGATIGAAREAGCQRVEFYTTSSWRFWRLFRRVGFFRRTSENYITARCPDRADVSQEKNWQLLPGDSDAF